MKTSLIFKAPESTADSNNWKNSSGFRTKVKIYVCMTKNGQNCSRETLWRY